MKRAYNGRPMTPKEERRILRGLRKGTGWRVLAQSVRRCGKTVRAIAQKYGIRSKRKIWSADEKQYLREHYPDTPTPAIAATLGRTLTQVYAQAKKLGIAKSAEYLREHARLQLGSEIGASYRFPKGHAPANKGVRRPGWSKGRMKETQVRKGQRPGNTLPVGTIKANADGYLRIKISDVPELPGQKGANSPNWEFVHKRAWEAAHGPIPRGHRLWWKDGNHENCVLENLELLTDQEHMARTTIHNLPPELKETIQVAARLTKAIRRRVKADAEKSTTGPA